MGLLLALLTRSHLEKRYSGILMQVTINLNSNAVYSSQSYKNKFPNYFVLHVLVCQNHRWANGKQLAAPVDWLTSGIANSSAVLFSFKCFLVQPRCEGCVRLPEFSATWALVAPEDTPQKFISLMRNCYTSVWMNSLTPGVWPCNKAGWREAQRGRRSQRGTRRAGEEGGRKRSTWEDKGGKKACNCSVLTALLEISPSSCLWLHFSLLSMVKGGEGTRTLSSTRVGDPQPEAAFH